MVASSYMLNEILDQELEEALMKFTTKYEENKVEANLIEQAEKIHTKADIVEVNITQHTKYSGADEMVGVECPDATESSSSFDGSDCGVESFDALGETEVLSDSRVDTATAMDFDGFDEIFGMRKKKLTNHWRTFIKPLMWHCKWVELQIKKFEVEAEKYDRELEKYRQQKLVRSEKVQVDDHGVKSLPFSKNYVRSEVFVRKKRRRDEATKDIAAYMSRHNLFSYYENREYFTNGAVTDIDLKSHAKEATEKVDIDDEFWSKDDILLENIFRKIDFLQSRVGQLKSRADKIITNENTKRFLSCLDNLRPIVVDNNGFYGLNADPTNNVVDGISSVGAYIVSQLIAEYKMRKFLVTESEVKSHREGGVIVRDANNARTNRVCFADPTENVSGFSTDHASLLSGSMEFLIDDPRMKEQMNNFEELKIQPVLADCNRGRPDDRRYSDICSILKTSTRPNKSGRDGQQQRVRFAV